jgi:hypothetical protein
MGCSVTNDDLGETSLAAACAVSVNSSPEPTMDCKEPECHHGARIIDVKAFLEKIEGGPVHSRARLEHGLEQLNKARQGEQFELLHWSENTHLRDPKVEYVFLRA